MNKLSLERRVQVIKALVEGNSILATCRITAQQKAQLLGFYVILVRLVQSIKISI
jgi:hypothetical protein